MDYLASYAGLQHLRSINTPSSTDSPVPSTFAQAILRHAPSLVSFCIEVNMSDSQASTWMGDLEINPLAWPKPSLFRQLKKLKVVSPKASSWQLTGDNFQKILDYATGIPQLKELAVIWSQTDRANFDQEWSRAEEALLIRRCKLVILEIDTCWPGINQTVFKLEFPPLSPSQQMGSEDSNPGEQLFQLKSFLVSWK